MTSPLQRVQKTADFLRERLDTPPLIGLLTGTGLGGITRSLAVDGSLPYRDIPHFPVSTVAGHTGRLVWGRLAEVPVVALEGRFHLYEGYSPADVTFPIRVMQALGVGTVILSNAAGGLNPNFSPGEIMVIRDHINLTGENPLVGPNEDMWGIRFPDMSRAYAPDLARTAARIGADRELGVRDGVYAGLKGPSLETPAEVRLLRTAGADAVGFSTVLETIAAVHAGMDVLGLSTITNVHQPDQPEPATLEEIISVAEDAAPRLEALLRGVVEAIHG